MAKPVLVKEKWLDVTSGPATSSVEGIIAARLWATLSVSLTGTTTARIYLQGSVDAIVWADVLDMDYQINGPVRSTQIVAGPYRYLRLKLDSLASGGQLAASVVAVEG